METSITKIIVCNMAVFCIATTYGGETYLTKATQNVLHHKNLNKKYNIWVKDNPYPIVNNVVKIGSDSRIVEGYEGILPVKKKHIQETIKAADLGGGNINCYIERVDKKHGPRHYITSYIKVKYLYFWYIKDLYEQRELAKQRESKGQ